MTSSPPVQFWFEFGSTYSYLAAARIEHVAAAAGVPFEWKPFLLGPIFKSQGWNDSPFNIYPAKGRYMWRDLERLCARYDLPFRKPSQFPRNGLLAARIACMADGEPWCPGFVRAVYHANFVADRDIGHVETILDILAACGQAGRATVDRALLPANKERLRRQTEEAIALGIFGAPMCVVGEELFWGDDRLNDAFSAARRLDSPRRA